MNEAVQSTSGARAAKPQSRECTALPLIMRLLVWACRRVEAR
jgi:hypothetical protein